MKLRVKNNSVRLRLTQTEVARFAESGQVEEAIEFGIGEAQNFIYALEVMAGDGVSAKFENNRITVFVPRATADEWTNTGKVGIEAEQAIGDGKILRLLIEKDFACVEPRAGDEDADAFSHPLEEKSC